MLELIRERIIAELRDHNNFLSWNPFRVCNKRELVFKNGAVIKFGIYHNCEIKVFHGSVYDYCFMDEFDFAAIKDQQTVMDCAQYLKDYDGAERTYKIRRGCYGYTTLKKHRSTREYNVGEDLVSWFYVKVEAYKTYTEKYWNLEIIKTEQYLSSEIHFNGQVYKFPGRVRNPTAFVFDDFNNKQQEAFERGYDKGFVAGFKSHISNQ